MSRAERRSETHRRWSGTPRRRHRLRRAPDLRTQPPGRDGGSLPGDGTSPSSRSRDAAARFEAATARRACRACRSSREVEVVRHFTRSLHLERLTWISDLYPLGSCTMKYNPKLNERWWRACRALRPRTRSSPRPCSRDSSEARVPAGAAAGRDQRHGPGDTPARRRRPGRAGGHHDDPRLLPAPGERSAAGS